MSNLYTEDLNIVKLLKINIFQSSQMKKEAARHGFNFILSVMEIHTCFSAAAE